MLQVISLSFNIVQLFFLFAFIIVAETSHFLLLNFLTQIMNLSFCPPFFVISRNYLFAVCL